MTCHDARASLSVFLDEALAPDERREVEAHLEGCAECRRELERLRQTVALLHRVEPARAPVGFVDRVAAAARPRPWYRRAAAAVFLPLSVKLPVEVTALVMVALLAVYVFERTPALQQAAREEAPRREEPRAQLADKLARPEPSGRRFAPPAPTPRGEDRRDALMSRDAQAPVPPPAVSAPAPPAPAAVPPPVAATPPATKKEAPSESKVGSVASPEAENRQKAAEQAARSLGTPPAAPRLAAKRAQPPADVIAGVAVKDRDATERDLAQLIARVGGSETQRRQEGDTMIVEALIPQARYAEFSEGLARIGPWQVEAERRDLPAQVRVILRLQ